MKNKNTCLILLPLVALLLNTTKMVAQCAKYEPPDGNILLIVGQDWNATGKSVYGAGYCDDALLGAVPPAGVTTYASSSLSPGQGITSVVDYGAGPLYADLYNSTAYYNNSVISVGFYMVNDLSNIINGSRDANLDALGNWIKSVSPRPVFLRIGYEFDYQYGCCPAQYIQAWQYIVNRYRTVLNVTNVAYVWQSASGGSPAATLLQWYPGDSYVDWFAYSHFYGNSGSISGSILNLARTKRKPVMIAESTPYGYRLDNASAATNAWTNYFTPLFTHINNNIDVIKAFCYINQDWDAQSLWSGQGWGNSRIQANGDGLIKTNWLTETNKSYWLHGTSTLWSVLQNSNVEQPFGGTARSIPGTIQAEDFDIGCEQLAYYDNSGGNSGGSTYRYGSSVDIGPTQDVSGAYDVGWTASGEWMNYTVNVAASGQYNFTFRIATANPGNTFHIEQDGVNVSGTINVPNTGSWSTYANLAVNNVSLTAGIHVLKIAFDNVPAFNINYFSVSSPLPVTLLSFSGSATNNVVELDWSSSTETNNHLYEIEKSFGNSNSFQKVGEVVPSGNSNTVSNYLYMDTTAQNGVYYYRLKQIDNNGSYTYSAILSVSITNGSSSTILSVFPNPFNNELSVLVNGNNKEYNITIMDVTGKIINSAKTYSVDEKVILAPGLPAGIYILYIEYEGQIKSFSMKKLND